MHRGYVNPSRQKHNCCTLPQTLQCPSFSLIRKSSLLPTWVSHVGSLLFPEHFLRRGFAVPSTRMAQPPSVQISTQCPCLERTLLTSLSQWQQHHPLQLLALPEMTAPIYWALIVPLARRSALRLCTLFTAGLSSHWCMGILVRYLGTRKQTRFHLKTSHLGSGKTKILHTALGPRPRWAGLTSEQPKEPGFKSLQLSLHCHIWQVLLRVQAQGSAGSSKGQSVSGLQGWYMCSGECL